MNERWVLVSAAFTPHGGQEIANHALARYLAELPGTEVHLVGYAASGALCALPSVRFHRVVRPLGSNFAGEPLLRARGLAVAAQVRRRDPTARVVCNGGNCPFPDVNWVHFVHGAWSPGSIDGPPWRAAQLRLSGAIYRRDERRAFVRARVLLANSRRTAEDLRRLGVAEEKVELLYLGAEVARGPASGEERRALRAAFGLGEAPLVTFVGALGWDDRKGLGVLLGALARLARRGRDVQLVVAGGGRVDRARRTARRLGIAERVTFLGQARRVPDLLATSDLLVAPTQYEPYGLAVQEALCLGVPALVSAEAGIAERYPAELRELLLANAADERALAERIAASLDRRTALAERTRALGDRLRERSWRQMAIELRERVMAHPPASSPGRGQGI